MSEESIENYNKQVTDYWLKSADPRYLPAVKWIIENDHFLFPLDGENAINHHARILTAYAFQTESAEIADLKAKLDAVRDRLRDVRYKLHDNASDCGWCADGADGVNSVLAIIDGTEATDAD